MNQSRRNNNNNTVHTNNNGHQQNQQSKQHQDDDISKDDDKTCSCGRYYGLADYQDHQQQLAAKQRQQEQQQEQNRLLDASFVHLSSSESQLTTISLEDEAQRKLSLVPNSSDPRQQQQQKASSSSPLTTTTSNSRTYLESYMHLEKLLVATANNPNKIPSVLLCEADIERVQRALDSDTERLENECIMYEKTAREEEERLHSLRKAVSNSAGGFPVSDAGVSSSRSCNSDLGNTKDAYRDEIDALREACEQHRAEFRHLQSLKQEQIDISKHLDELQYSLEDQRNALELHARAFNNDQEQLHRSLEQIQSEVDQLSSNIQLPTILLDLQVDKQRGLRYPLINELRLAYRPRGDISSQEIQVAWSLAAQLLLYIGTLFQFQSQHWKIVPLTDCAKLICYQDDHNSTITITNNNNNKASNTSRSSSSRAYHHQQQQQQQQQKRRAVVYQLGHPKSNNTSKALLAWNALLHQVILHATRKQRDAIEKGIVVTVTSSTTIPDTSPLETRGREGTTRPNRISNNATATVMNRRNNNNNNNSTSNDGGGDDDNSHNNPFPELPYPISSSTIGTIRLSELDDTDDLHWSRAIHFMASNLLWLSECASLYTSQRVLSSTLSAVVQKAL